MQNFKKSQLEKMRAVYELKVHSRVLSYPSRGRGGRDFSSDRQSLVRSGRCSEPRPCRCQTGPVRWSGFPPWSLSRGWAPDVRSRSPPERRVSAQCFRKYTPWVRHSPSGSPIYFKRPANFPPYSTQDSMLFGSGFQRHRRPSSITWNPAASSLTGPPGR